MAGEAQLRELKTNRITTADRRIAAREGCTMQWNGQGGVREYRAAHDAQPDTRDPDEEPRRVCIGEVCEPLS